MQVEILGGVVDVKQSTNAPFSRGYKDFLFIGESFENL
jgi:hypothetical protein